MPNGFWARRRGTVGDPLSWRHYEYGLRYLGRTHLRDQLRMAQAFRIAAASVGDDGVDHYAEWQGRVSQAVGTGG